MDEKSFRRRHNYVTVLTDLAGSRVLEVAEGRDEKAADKACVRRQLVQPFSDN
jgi:hypothetical protein